MASFVLVHGGWGGGWEWQLVAARLQQRGHDVHRPTLTGLGERSHLGRPDTDLETHIGDVRGLLEFEDLHDVVLVGQSYGGAVVTGVADRAAKRIGHLVYLDAFVPEDGQSVNDLCPPGFVDQVRRLAADVGDGWLVPLPFDADEMGHPPEVAEWYVPKLGSHPLASLEQPLRLTGAVEQVRRTYITCSRTDERSVFSSFAERAQQEGWGFHVVPVGHDAHVIAPDVVAQLLHEIATD